MGKRHSPVSAKEVAYVLFSCTRSLGVLVDEAVWILDCAYYMVHKVDLSK